jgi:hypothetical protein
VSLRDVIIQFMYFIRVPTRAGTGRCNLHGSLQPQINMQTETARYRLRFVGMHFMNVLDSVLLMGLLLRRIKTRRAHT